MCVILSISIRLITSLCTSPTSPTRPTRKELTSSFCEFQCLMLNYFAKLYRLYSCNFDSYEKGLDSTETQFPTSLIFHCTYKKKTQLKGFIVRVGWYSMQVTYQVNSEPAIPNCGKYLQCTWGHTLVKCMYFQTASRGKRLKGQVCNVIQISDDKNSHCFSWAFQQCIWPSQSWELIFYFRTITFS